MGRRWIGLGRSKRAPRAKPGRTLREAVRALSAAGVLLGAAALNFMLHPDALAAVLSGEHPFVEFVSEEPSQNLGANAPLDESDVRLLAATVWAEARSEGENGMRAVAHVIVNRIGHRFGADVASVIRSPAQFSAWNAGDPNRPLAEDPERFLSTEADEQTWQAAQRIAREVLSGQSVDPTRGALFYHTRAVRPYWSRQGEGRQVIGAHVFYTDVRGVRRARARATTIAVSDDTPRYIDGVRLDPSPGPTEADADTEDTPAAS